MSNLPFWAQAAAASVLLACVPELSAPTTIEEHRAAIVASEDDPGDPAVLEIFVNGAPDCTGSLVSPHVVLTAAHCVSDLAAGDVVAVFTGADDARRTDGQLVPVKEAHFHPDYDRNTDRADLGVMILGSPLAIAPLPYNRQPLDESFLGKPVRRVGFGDSTVPVETRRMGRRRQTTSPLLSFDKDWINVANTDKSQCYGDSGGPVLMVINGVETLVGIDSFQPNSPCDSANGNTRVDGLADFVDPYVAANDPAPTSDFAVSVTPTSALAQPGGSASFAVSLTATGTEVHTLSIAGLPRSVTAAFVPPTLTGTGTATLTLFSGGEAHGSLPFVVTAQRAGVTRTASGTLVVNRPATLPAIASAPEDSASSGPKAGCGYAPLAAAGGDYVAWLVFLGFVVVRAARRERQ